MAAKWQPYQCKQMQNSRGCFTMFIFHFSACAIWISFSGSGAHGLILFRLPTQKSLACVGLSDHIWMHHLKETVRLCSE